jgi:hypothetical protein
MSDTESVVLADAINALQEPYRRNAIEWLEACTQSTFSDLARDMDVFLDDLPPIVRDTFVGYVGKLMEEAGRHFGITRFAGR